MSKNLVFIEALTREAADVINGDSKLISAFQTAVFKHGGNVMPFPNAEFSFFTTVENFEKIATAGVFDASIIDAFTKAQRQMRRIEIGYTDDMYQEEIEDHFYACTAVAIAGMKDVRVSIKKKFG